MKVKTVGLLLAGILFSFQAFAHDPIGIEMKRDLENNRISIAVEHPVGSGHSHYIRKIEVLAGSAAPIRKVFRFQKANHQRMTVDIPGLAKITKIVIKAYCNKGGFLSRTFTIEKPDQ